MPAKAAAHFLDTLPFDYGRPESLELRDLLAGAYRREQDISALLDKTGIPSAYIQFSQPNIYVWHDILIEARNRALLRPLLENVLGDKSKSAVHARLQELLHTRPAIEATSSAALSGPEPDPDTLERIIGRVSSLVDICFLEGGLRKAPSIARLLVSFGQGEPKPFWGSAFLIEAPGPPLLLTNYHVLFEGLAHDAARASHAQAWFNYEMGLDGKPKELHSIECDTNTIVGDAEFDWAALRLKAPLPAAYPALPLKTPSKPVEPFDRAYIIQHPQGGMKKIGMHHNDIYSIDDRYLQYVTDTDAGSSGSPVFNEQWEVIALHHRYVEISMGERVPPVYRNQGIRIERVREGLVSAGLLPKT